MTLDGGVPDPDWQRITREPTRTLAVASGLVSRATGGYRGPDAHAERMRRIRVTLRQAHVDLLRAHAATVAALGQIGADRERLWDALVEARSQHEALYLVWRAVDALATPDGAAGR